MPQERVLQEQYVSSRSSSIGRLVSHRQDRKSRSPRGSPSTSNMIPTHDRALLGYYANPELLPAEIISTPIRYQLPSLSISLAERLLVAVTVVSVVVHLLVYMSNSTLRASALSSSTLVYVNTFRRTSSSRLHMELLIHILQLKAFNLVFSRRVRLSLHC